MFVTAINRQQDVIFDGCVVVAALTTMLGHLVILTSGRRIRFTQQLTMLTYAMLLCRTMMWPPFVKQCIAMVRDHEHNYVRGPGYNKDDNGNVTERYVSATFAIFLSTYGVALARAL